MTNILLVIILAISSVGIYLIQYYIFQKPEVTIFNLFQDLAFVPVQVIVVTLLLDKLMNIIEKKQNRKRVNVIISAFFAELGTSIISELSKLTENHAEFCEIIKLTDINRNNMNAMKKNVKQFDYKVNVTPEKLEALGLVLNEKKSFMLGLLENSSLLEHDSFTDMLWAIFHVADELQSRENLKGLSKIDLEHLKVDILRAYRLIIIEWVTYMKYLNAEYPYLYNLAIRKNPFNFACSQKNNDCLE